jgi:hypothetical protein
LVWERSSVRSRPPAPFWYHVLVKKDLPVPPSHPHRALPGPTADSDPKPRKRRHPNAVEAGRPHKWSTSGGVDRFGTPSWLNDNAGTNPQCSVCGVTLLAGDINADHEGFGAEVASRPDLKAAMRNPVTLYKYRDAKGHEIQSQVPLGCPTFITHDRGYMTENRERIRGVDDRVDHTEDRIDETEDRLSALERENEELRSRVDAAEADVSAVVRWLAEMVALHQTQGGETVKVQVEGRPVAALPPPVADLILDLGSVPEPETIDAEFEESDTSSSSNG